MILENIALALASLRANKMRALLTMLGIIIGIASVIAIVTIGNALTASVNSRMSAFGANNINVFVQEKGRNIPNMTGGFGNMLSGPRAGGMTVSIRIGGGAGSQPEDSDLISTSMIDDFIAEYSDDVAGVALSNNVGSAEVREGDLYANISITGVNEDYLLSNNIDVTSGRFISDKDVDKSRNVAVVSDRFVSNMFKNGEDPLSKQVKVFKSDAVEMYTIVGVYKYEASGMEFSTSSEQDISTNFYIPVSTSKIGDLSKNFRNITVVAGENTDVLAFADETRSYFEDIYRNNSAWTVNVMSLESQLESILGALDSIRTAIAFIAGISLLVGGIGVMNIMLVSVTERTREIGTRKALGAKNFHVRLQFVTEAVIISGIGGVIGALLGTMVGSVISVYMDAPVTISTFVIIASVAFSMVIGVFFGYYPANKAAKLDPIDALRYE